MSDAETIAEVLAAHQDVVFRAIGRFDCVCGASGSGTIVDHTAHQAEMVAAALEPVNRERERVAYNVGYDKAKDDGDFYDITPNPYDTKEEA